MHLWLVWMMMSWRSASDHIVGEKMERRKLAKVNKIWINTKKEERTKGELIPINDGGLCTLRIKVLTIATHW